MKFVQVVIGIVSVFDSADISHLLVLQFEKIVSYILIKVIEKNLIKKTHTALHYNLNK